MMPKPGLKYFIGSFLLSLVAVFVAAKAYLLITWTEQHNEPNTTSTEVRDIELFALNEESDPIYEKYKQIEAVEKSVLSDMPEDFDSNETLAESDEEILYEAQTDENSSAISDISEQDDFLPDTQENINIALEKDSLTDEIITAENDASVSKTETDDLQITDAAEAPVFIIPLEHSYNIEGGRVTVSDHTDSGQIALASHDVSIYNLGTEGQASITEPLDTDETSTAQVANEVQTSKTEQSATLSADIASPQMDNDDPWEVAETSNKYVAKNSLSVKSQTESADVDLPAQEAEVAYRPQQNILIPIPEDIMNDDNLTPQFSTSKENLKIEEELRATHQLPTLNDSQGSGNDASASDNQNDGGQTGTSNKKVQPMAPLIEGDDDERDFDDLPEENDAEEQTSKNLTDSVAAWFSGIRDKMTGSNSDATNQATTDSSPVAKQSSGNSIFQKLLGNKEQEKKIAPSELKITFQPNKAEISGQTLDWLRAFADNTIENENVVVEIRASQMSSAAIQKKRLNLLYKVLADKGVGYDKVNVIFTHREPNSFIIRNVRYPSEEDLAQTATKTNDNPW